MQTRKVIALIGLSVLLTSLFCYTVFSPNLSFDTVIEEGSMITETNYLIFRDSSTYYARDGETGEIAYSGTNASDVITDCLGNYTTITFKTYQGSYLPILLTHSILIQNYTRYLTFQGEGDNGLLQLADAANCDMFQVYDGCHWLTWRGLYLHGSIDTQTGLSHGIHFMVNGSTATSDIEIVDNAIVNFNGSPVYFEGTVSASYVRHNYIEDSANASIRIGALHTSTIESNVLWNCTTGIQVDSTARPRQDNVFDGNTIDGMTSYGIFLNSSNNNRITDNRVSNSENGIYVNLMNYGTISDNYVITIDRDGYDMYSLQFCSITGNEAYGCSQETNDTYVGFQMGALGSGECHNNLFTGNLGTTTNWSDKMQYGLFLSGDNNMILDSFMTGTDSGFTISGSNNEIHDCYNWTSYIS